MGHRCTLLSPPNSHLLVGEGRAPSIRLADYGNAMAIEELARLPADAGLQTLWYRAPEVKQARDVVLRKRKRKESLCPPISLYIFMFVCVGEWE